MKKLFNLLLGFLLIGWMANPAMAQNRTVTGKVTSDKDKEILIGVTVVVKGTTIGTATDENGNYSISVPANKSVLVFTYVGMKKTDVSIGTNTTLDVALLDDGKGLDEVVITAIALEKSSKSPPITSFGFMIIILALHSLNRLIISMGLFIESLR